jgi:hypothetical protein
MHREAMSNTRSVFLLDRAGKNNQTLLGLDKESTSSDKVRHYYFGQRYETHDPRQSIASMKNSMSRSISLVVGIRYLLLCRLGLRFA